MPDGHRSHTVFIQPPARSLHVLRYPGLHREVLSVLDSAVSARCVARSGLPTPRLQVATQPGQRPWPVLFGISGEQATVTIPVLGDLCHRVAPTPSDTAVMDPVVRPAWQRPVADRGGERHVLAIVDNGPLCWGEWCDDLVAATAAAKVTAGAVGDRDIQNPCVHRRGEGLGEDRAQGVLCGHGRSSLAISLVISEYVVWPSSVASA
jgi:hypothetical protein